MVVTQVNKLGSIIYLGSPGTMLHVKGVLNLMQHSGHYDIIGFENFDILISEGLKHTVVICSFALRTFGVQHEGELHSMTGAKDAMARASQPTKQL